MIIDNDYSDFHNICFKTLSIILASVYYPIQADISEDYVRMSEEYAPAEFILSPE